MPHLQRFSSVKKVALFIAALVVIFTLGTVVFIVWMTQSDGSRLSFDGYYGGSTQTVGSYGEGMPSPMPSKSMPPTMPGGGAVPSADRDSVGPQVIKNATLRLRVADASQTLEQLSALATTVAGYTDQSNLSEDSNGIRRGYILLRVPTPRLEDTIKAAKKLASLVMDESVNSQDVTDVVVDLDAHLKAAKAEEAQYLEILKSAKQVDDILNITQRLADVRYRIERMESQKRVLSDQVEYATLTINVEEETRVEVPSRTWKPLETLRLSFRGLVNALQGLVDVLIGVVVYGVGFILPLLLVLWGIYRLVRLVLRKSRR